MLKCIVCNNHYSRTKYTRPNIIYHSFPKNEYIKKQWLKILNLDHCEEWHRVCSEHFLQSNYKEGKRTLFKNTIPQSFNRNATENNVSDNTITQNNDNNNEQIMIDDNNEQIMTDHNNEDLPMRLNLSREDHIENAVGSPRRSIRKIKLTTTYEDMSYENMPRLQTERFEPTISTHKSVDDNQVVSEPISPMTIDHSIGNGLRCSIKNCNNRFSKYLSFFGYPNNVEMKKIWIKQCGLVGVDPTQKIKTNLKICGFHFEEDMFITPAKRNRLKPEAIPTLFLNENASDISSINYYEDVESNRTGIIGEDNLHAENIDSYYCYIPECITNNTDEEADDVLCLFTPSMDAIVNSYSIFGVQLNENSFVCEKHFRPEDIIIYKNILTDGPNKVTVKTLKPNAMPFATNAAPLVTVSVPLETVDVPLETVDMPLETVAVPTTMDVDDDITILKIVKGQLKRSMGNDVEENLSSKKVKNNLIDKSNATTETVYISDNDDDGFISTTDYIHQYTSNKILNPMLESNIVKTNTLSNNTANSSTSNTSKSSFEKILANSSLSITFKSNNEQSVNKQIIAIDNTKEVVPSCIEMPEPIPDVSEVYMLPTTSDNSSMIGSNLGKRFSNHISDISPSITVNPATEIEVPTILLSKDRLTFDSTSTASQEMNTGPVSKDDALFPSISIDDTKSDIKQKLKKISANSSLSISLKPIKNTKVVKPSKELFSKTASMSITLQSNFKQSLPSTSNSSVNNTSQSSSLQYAQEASTLRLSSNTISTESIESQAAFLKYNSPSSKPNTHESYQMPKLKPSSPVREPQECNMANVSVMNYISINPDCFKPDPDIIGKYMGDKMKDQGFIRTIYKVICLPNIQWSCFRNASTNTTTFTQRDSNSLIIKKIVFENDLLPTIHINGRKYEYDEDIITRAALQDLIDKIDSIKICTGYNGFNNDKCIGYYENTELNTEMCSTCLDLITNNYFIKVETVVDYKDGSIPDLISNVG